MNSAFDPNSYYTEDCSPLEPASSKRKRKVDTDSSYNSSSSTATESNLPISLQLDNTIPVAETTVSHKGKSKEASKLIHNRIEQERRRIEAKHLLELSSLVKNWYDPKSAKLPQLNLLEVAADILDNINLRYQNDPLRPSHLTEDEVNFLNFEASNAFLFVTTTEPSSFRIIHVTDSVHRTLDSSPEQWLGQDLFSFIHPDDLIHVQSQLMSFVQGIDKKSSTKCRLQQGNGSYSSVIIDGIVKKIDQSLQPVSMNECGYFAFIGVCHIPLLTKYNEINMRLYKNPESLKFCCRCSINDWIIFLVDRSVTTFPSLSSDSFINKSILDFIQSDEQDDVHQALLHSTKTLTKKIVICHFNDSISGAFLPMILEMKPVLNPVSKKIDFMELNFQYILDIANDTSENRNFSELDLLLIE